MTLSGGEEDVEEGNLEKSKLNTNFWDGDVESFVIVVGVVVVASSVDIHSFMLRSDQVGSMLVHSSRNLDGVS